MKFSRDQKRTILAMAGIGQPPAGAPRPKRARPVKPLAVPFWRIEFVVPLRTYSQANLRDAHWSERKRRASAARAAVDAALLGAGLATVRLPPPFNVTLTRLGGRKLDEGDNLPAALKSVRDQVSAWLRVDDGDELMVRWSYSQRPGLLWGVRVEVTPKGTPCDDSSAA